MDRKLGWNIWTRLRLKLFQVTNPIGPSARTSCKSLEKLLKLQTLTTARSASQKTPQ